MKPEALNALAHKMAESSAKSAIDSFTISEQYGRYKWHDLSQRENDQAWQAWLDEAVKYLDARGLLIRHRKHMHLVRWEGA